MKKRQRNKAALAAGILAAGIGLGNLPVWAADAPDAVSLLNVRKTLEVAEGFTLRNVEFSFTAEAAGENSGDAPALAMSGFSYSGQTTGQPVTQTLAITEQDGRDGDTTVNGGDFPHAGVYEYTIAETAGSDRHVAYDGNQYTLKIFVANAADGGLEIRSVEYLQEETARKAAPDFVNTYTDNTASLTVTKQVEGDYGDRSKEFGFSIQLILPSTYAPEEENPTVTGSAGGQEVSVLLGSSGNAYTGSAVFTLSDDESLTFTDLPVGTRYVVTEAGAKGDGYTASGVSVVENGGSPVEITNSDEASSLASAAQGSTNLIGQGTNTAVFTNEYQEITPTGIVLRNLPYLVLAAAAAAGIGIYAVLRKKSRR